MRVLIVEPDTRTAQATSGLLRLSGMTADRVGDGETALAHAELLSYQAIVLELALPDMTGLAFLRRLRDARVSTPVLFVSACGDVEMRVRALSLGADDYLVKPVCGEELVARLRTAIRRAAGCATSVLDVGDLSLDLAGQSVRIAGQPVRLTHREYAVLELLALRPGQTIERRFLLDHLYGGRDEPGDKIVDVFICKLRRKIRRAGGKAVIDTIWGRGFALRERAAA